MSSYKLLAEKYSQVLEEEGNDLAALLHNLENSIKTVNNRDLSSAFNQVLLALNASTDNNVKQAAITLLNQQTQIASEEDEAIGNETDVTGIGY
jgi:hypothetical protein